MEITINYYGQAVSVSVEVYEYLTQADHKTENLAHEQRRHWDGRGCDEYIISTEGRLPYHGNMFNKGSAKLYERFGPLFLACDVEEYQGEFLHARPEERHIYISEDGKKIVVAYFFLRPVFSVPLE